MLHDFQENLININIISSAKDCRGNLLLLTVNYNDDDGMSKTSCDILIVNIKKNKHSFINNCFVFCN